MGAAAPGVHGENRGREGGEGGRGAHRGREGGELLGVRWADGGSGGGGYVPEPNEIGPRGGRGVVNTSPNQAKTNENERSTGRGVSCKR